MMWDGAEFKTDYNVPIAVYIFLYDGELITIIFTALVCLCVCEQEKVLWNLFKIIFIDKNCLVAEQKTISCSMLS